VGSYKRNNLQYGNKFKSKPYGHVNKSQRIGAIGPQQLY